MDASVCAADWMTPSEIIGWRLRRERLRLGLDQCRLAEKLGISRMSQSNYETGKRSPDALYLMSAYAAGVDVCWVITGKRAMEAH